MRWLPGSICALLLFGGCASKPCHERGWIGGTVMPVTRCGDGCRTPPAYDARGVVGMPPAVRGARGLLVTHVPQDSPAYAAGLRESDLVLAVDGRPPGAPTAFRRAVERREPGSTMTLGVWRGGARLDLPVVVGRERYHRVAVIGAYVPFPTGLRLDLWPFDDGIDVLGLVTARTDDRRRDLLGPERAYLRRAIPGREAPVVRQETVDVRVFPLAAGGGVRVVSQEAVGAVDPES